MTPTHRLRQSRHSIGMTATAPSRPLYGTVGTCECGARYKVNTAPSKGGTAAIKKWFVSHQTSAETAAPYFDAYKTTSLLIWALDELGADPANTGGLRAALNVAAKHSANRNAGAHDKTLEALTELDNGNRRLAAIHANAVINLWSFGFPPALRPRLPA
jgi:hypothetical protein